MNSHEFYNFLVDVWMFSNIPALSVASPPLCRAGVERRGSGYLCSATPPLPSSEVAPARYEPFIQIIIQAAIFHRIL